MLLAIAASGYAGTDFIENAFTNLLPALKPVSPSNTASPAPSDKPAGAQTNPGPAVAHTISEVRTSANASIAVISSIQTAFDKLGANALDEVQKAAVGHGELKGSLNQANTALAAMSAQIQKLTALSARAKALLTLPDNSTPSDIQAAFAAAQGVTDSVHGLNDTFLAALDQFQQARTAILKATAQG